MPAFLCRRFAPPSPPSRLVSIISSGLHVRSVISVEMQGYDSPTVTSKLYRGILAVKRVFEILKFKYAPRREMCRRGLPFPLDLLFFFLCSLFISCAVVCPASATWLT